MVDRALVAVFLVWGLLEAAFVNSGNAYWAAIGYALPLLWRRRFPLAALVAIALVSVIRFWTTDVPDQGAMPFPALLVATFSVALYERRLWVSLLGWAIPVALVALSSRSPEWQGERLVQDYAIFLFFITAAWVAGYVLHRRTSQGRERAREAVALERARIARELHDIVAHSVSIIALQAGAAEALVVRDPAAAQEHMATVRHMAHDALGEMRRLLGVLREDQPVYEPTPDLADVDELVLSSGLSVALSRTGDFSDVPAGVSLAVYRIVQESLTNVRKHAGSVPARVSLLRDRDRIDVVVENDPGDVVPSSNGGYGLLGMRERVRVYGGTLRAEPSDEGGFRVAASIPVGEADA